LTPDSKPILKCFLGCVLAAGLAFGTVSSAQVPAVGSAPGVPAAPVAPPKPRFVVVLDAAHGGDDGGGQIGASVAEKTVTLALSVRLRSLLAARGFAVVTTREGNVNLDSDARAQIANRAVALAGGSACLSLHASQTGAGVHIFVSSLEAAAATRFLAWKTAQSAYVSRSLKLAGTVNSALEHSSGASGDSGEANAGPIPATLARASLPGLDSMTCPALAIEVAPIRDADRKVVTEVTDPQYQTQVVEALAAALLEWKTDVETESRPEPRSAGGALP
jgi:N-acetylmuramoyl-L-alanine amidase